MDLVVNELHFKRNSRHKSFWALIILTSVLLLNLGAILYWNPTSLSDNIVIAMITATFANVFALIALIFRFIFSPTREILDYTKGISKDSEDE